MIRDYETESLNLYLARPWQVSWLVFTAKEIIEEANHYLWWENLKVSKGAAFITRFNYNHYKANSKDPKVIRPLMDKYLKDPNIIVLEHNGLRFDTFVDDTYNRLIGLPKYHDHLYTRYIDTSFLIKGHRLGLKPDRANLYPWLYKVSQVRKKGLKTNLEQMGKEYKIEHDYANLHDALCDNLLLKKIFSQKLIWEIEI